MDPIAGVYESTTEPKGKAGEGRCCGCKFGRLGWQRLLLKAAQALLSFLAFILEEIVESCTVCGGLYFFEFISFTATFLSVMILTVYHTSLYEKIEEKRIPKLDFRITTLVGIVFLIASIVFAATNDKSSVETVAIVFGFLASIVFLADGIQMFMETRKRKESKSKNVGNTENGVENQPLKNQT
nr:CKLF-like MARVEL transmembrane domain-containing protein 6 [Pelodiscus sinensis]|eukprot:XP_006134358.1 CKLF-like MARVEL transmembrane domain-containing protein 6 [Pelodiscus sinensis]